MNANLVNLIPTENLPYGIIFGNNTPNVTNVINIFLNRKNSEAISKLIILRFPFAKSATFVQVLIKTYKVTKKQSIYFVFIARFIQRANMNYKNI